MATQPTIDITGTNLAKMAAGLNLATPVPPVPPVAPTPGNGAYSGAPITGTPGSSSTPANLGLTPDQSALNDALHNQTVAAGMSTATTSSDRASVAGQFQSEIDALNSVYADQKAAETTAGLNRVGSNTAIEARRGLLGSDMGNAATDTVNTANAAAQKAIDDKHNQDLASVYSSIDTAAQNAANARVTAAQKGADAAVNEIKGRQQATTDAVTSAVGAYFAAGNDGSKLTDQNIADWATKLGTTSDVITNAIVAAKKADVATANTTATAAQTADKSAADIANTKAQTAKIYNDIKTSGNNSITSDDVSNIVGNLSDYNGTKYVTATDLTGYSTADKNTIMHALAAQGIKPLSTKDADVMNTITTSKLDLNSISDSINSSNGVLPKAGIFSAPIQFANVTLDKWFKYNPDLGSFATWGASVLSIINGIKGTGSGRISPTSFAGLMPVATDTLEQANSKIQKLNTLLDNTATGIVGTSATSVDYSTATFSGLTATIPGQGTMTFPNQAALNQFKTDNNIK